jgi:HSP20 family molecular chaperone IbpA
MTDASTFMKEDDKTIHIRADPPTLPYELLSQSEGYLFLLDLPGVIAGQDYLVETDDKFRVTIQGTRRSTAEGQKIVSQRLFGKFEIEMMIPKTFDIANVLHTYNNGVLTIKVPWNRSSKPM